ncbi:MAG: CAAD domain-containing protein [Nodosilinea sp.]
MNPEFESEAPYTEPEKPVVVVDASDSVDSTASALGDEASRQVKQVWDKVSGLLGDLPDYVSEFFKRYRRPIVTIGLIIAAIIAVKLVLALLGAVNDVPLLAPTFELIGLLYSGWFLYRYLLKASNREELLNDITSVRDQVLGKNS